MLSVDRLIEIAPPDIDLSWEKREFPSPDGDWTAVYHSPREQPAGTMGWQASLVEASSRSDLTPRPLQNMSSGEGLICPSDFMPWRYDSQSLVLLPWNGTPRLLNPKSGKLTSCDVVATPLSAQWAFARPYLIAAYFDRITLLERQGKWVADMTWQPADDEIPYTGWTHDDTIFVLRQPSSRAKPRITFYDPEHPFEAGQPIGLDPDRLVPYDIAEYEGLARDRGTLIIGRGQHLAGALLDTWHQIRFEPARKRLLLSVYRPVGPPFKSGGWVCEVEEKWFALPL
jgi:hypothetical protein